MNNIANAITTMRNAISAFALECGSDLLSMFIFNNKRQKKVKGQKSNLTPVLLQMSSRAKPSLTWRSRPVERDSSMRPSADGLSRNDKVG